MTGRPCVATFGTSTLFGPCSRRAAGVEAPSAADTRSRGALCHSQLHSEEGWALLHQPCSQLFLRFHISFPFLALPGTQWSANDPIPQTRRQPLRSRKGKTHCSCPASVVKNGAPSHAPAIYGLFCTPASTGKRADEAASRYIKKSTPASPSSPCLLYIACVSPAWPSCTPPWL